MMISIRLQYFFFILLIALAGCRKDEKTEGQTIIEPTGDPTIEVASGVTGLVLDEDGIPIANASVRVYDKQLATDDNGIFYINNEGLNKASTVVHVQKNGFFDGFKSFLPEVGQKAFIELQMISKGVAQTISSSDEGTVDIGGGAELILPSNAFVLKSDGSAYNGPISVYAHWYDPENPDLGTSMPGNLLGITTDGDEAQLGTFGKIAVELETSNGIALQLAENATATLKFPVSGNLAAPNSIPLWSFDEWDAVWQQDGVALLKAGFYEAEVTHFAFWNCDTPFPLVTLEGRILDEEIPVANYPISIFVDNLLSAQGYTNSEGIFRGKVPRKENLVLTIRHCDQTIYSEELGVFEEDTDVGNINIDLKNYIVAVQGRMIGCDSEALQSAYGLVRSGNDVIQVITPIANGTDEDGTFNSVIAGCQGDNYSIEFINPENQKTTGIIGISPDNPLIDFGDVRICEEIEEFIELNRDGEIIAFYNNANVYYSNQSKLIVRGFDENSNTLLRFEVLAQEEGEYSPSNFYFDNTGEFGNGIIAICGDDINNFYGCDKFSVNISKFGDYIEGSFSGFLTERDSLTNAVPIIMEYFIEGTFRLRIDSFISTGEISGQLWIDQNENFIRDDNEGAEGLILTATVQNLDNPQFPLLSLPMPLYEGFYKFTNLLPGRYIVSMIRLNEYVPVEINVGSEDRDNDFFNIDNAIYNTEEIVIDNNEVIENIDLGVVLIPSLSCGPLEFEGCSPLITVSTTIIGGLPPYWAIINDAPLQTVGANALFTLEEGGEIIVEIFDSDGNSCQSTGFVDNYNNHVFGIVWRDIEGLTPNIRDVDEPGMHDVLVSLLNDDNVIERQMLTNEGSYFFDDLPPKSYFILIELPGDTELVQKNVDLEFGSDLDSTTARSDIFTIEECNSSIRIDAGLRTI